MIPHADNVPIPNAALDTTDLQQNWVNWGPAHQQHHFQQQTHNALAYWLALTTKLIRSILFCYVIMNKIAIFCSRLRSFVPDLNFKDVKIVVHFSYKCNFFYSWKKFNTRQTLRFNVNISPKTVAPTSSTSIYLFVFQYFASPHTGF